MANGTSSLERSLGGDIIALLIMIGIGFGLIGSVLGSKGVDAPGVPASPAWYGGPEKTEAVTVASTHKQSDTARTNAPGNRRQQPDIAKTGVAVPVAEEEVALQLKDVDKDDAEKSPLLNYLFRYKKMLAFQGTLAPHERKSQGDLDKLFRSWQSSIRNSDIEVFLEIRQNGFPVRFEQHTKSYILDEGSKSSYILCGTEGNTREDLCAKRCLKLNYGQIRFSKEESTRVWKIFEKIKELKAKDDIASIESIIIPIRTRVGNWVNDKIKNVAEPAIRVSGLNRASFSDAVAVFYNLIGEAGLVRIDIPLPPLTTTDTAAAATGKASPFKAEAVLDAPALPGTTGRAAHEKRLAPVASLSFEPLSTWKNDKSLMQRHQLKLADGVRGKALEVNGEEFRTDINMPEDEGTIMFWFRPQKELTSPKRNVRVLVDLGHGDDNKFVMAFRQTKKFQLGIRKEGVWVVMLENPKETRWYPKWYHAAFVYGPKGCALYINGAKVAEKKVAINFKFLQHSRLSLGTYNGKFKGEIDELAVWERQLTIKEMGELCAKFSKGESYCPTIGGEE